MRRIRALEGQARRGELVAAEEPQTVGERLVVDAVRADARGQRACCFGERLRLACVHPHDRGEVAARQREADGPDESVGHVTAILWYALPRACTALVPGRAPPFLVVSAQ